MSCPGCFLALETWVFPALFKGPVIGQAADAVMVDGEAACFYHPRKRAAVACDRCGRFLCNLCDVELDRKHLCPQCLESGLARGEQQTLENRRVLYDSVALSLAILPLLFFYFTILTAPVAIFVAVRYWKKPGSIVKRTRMRFVMAILIASLEIAGWATLFGFLIWGGSR